MEIINNYCEMLNLNQAVKYKAYDLKLKNLKLILLLYIVLAYVVILQNQ